MSLPVGDVNLNLSLPLLHKGGKKSLESAVAAAGRCLLSKHLMSGPRPAAALLLITVGVSRGRSEKFHYESCGRGDKWLFLAHCAEALGRVEVLSAVRPAKRPKTGVVLGAQLLASSLLSHKELHQKKSLLARWSYCPNFLFHIPTKKNPKCSLFNTHTPAVRMGWGCCWQQRGAGCCSRAGQ